MKKYLSKILVILFFIIECAMFLPDIILYLSWKNEKNFYKLIPFLGTKSYINSEDFIDSATKIIINWYYISYILFFIILIISIIDIVKNNSKLNIIFNVCIIILSFLIIAIVYKHHKIIDFYFDPANDLPWDYRKI